MTKLEKISVIIIIILALLNAFFFAMILSSPLTPGEAVGVILYRVLNKINPSGSKQLEKMHLEAEKISYLRCISCHGLKATQKGTYSIHAIHLPSVENDFKCTDCHTRIEFGEIIGKEPKKKVNLKKCAKCHEEMRETAKVPETPKDHEDEEWPNKLHGRMALEKGEEACFECHQHGLDFCKDCHRLKPISHTRSFKAFHKKLAEETPENCYYCHETSFCKQCHVKHTKDWMDLHRKAVQEKGGQQCLHCHTLNYCTDCHKKQVGKGR